MMFVFMVYLCNQHNYGLNRLPPHSGSSPITLSDPSQHQQIMSRINTHLPPSDKYNPNLIKDPYLRSTFLELIRIQAQGLSARYVTPDTIVPAQNTNFLLWARFIHHYLISFIMIPKSTNLPSPSAMTDS
jgi:hypothetical protein